MKKAYLLVFGGEIGTREQVREYLNAIKEITHWRYEVPNSFFVISEQDATFLSRRLRELSSAKGRFIFVEIGSNRNGWLSTKSWYLIKNKKYKPAQ
jgi:hypothetical protein